MEKTGSVVVPVRDLIPDSGASQVAYIFGYRSKKLIQINIQWGWPVDPKVIPESVVATANILRRHFAEKGLEKERLLMNVPVSQGNVIVFRGTDAKNRMIILQLISTAVTADRRQGAEEKGGVPEARVSLRLSYISNPDKPDVFRLSPEKF